MNERIKEIYLEATKSIIGSRDIDAEQLALLSTIDEYDLKFAELIIQECINEINLCRYSNRSVPYEKLDLFDQGEAQAVSSAINAIKHKFGI